MRLTSIAFSGLSWVDSFCLGRIWARKKPYVKDVERVEQAMQYSLFQRIDKQEEVEGSPAANKRQAMKDIEALVADCTKCRLHSTRTNTVPGEGNLDARMMFVGEGPGADEDAKGRPFVGAAGKLLDNIIIAMGMHREEVYIGNVVKCRPPANRLPEKDEMDSCLPYLEGQIKAIDPAIIVLLGSTAYKAIIKDSREGITKVRGQVIELDGRIYIPTFHPAALLRDPSKKKDVWADMKKVLSLLGKES